MKPLAIIDILFLIIRMTTFIKAKLKKSDDQTNIEYLKISNFSR